MDLAVPVDYRVKIKENEIRDKYLDLARKLKNQWNTVTVIPIVIGARVSIPKGLVRRNWKSEDKRRPS